MKILTCYYKPKPGGFCRRYFRCIEALLARGHEVHYLSLERFPIDHDKCIFHRFHWPANSESLLFWALWHIVAPIQLAYLTVRLKIDRPFAFNPTYGFLLQVSKFLSKDRRLTIFLHADPIQTHIINGKSQFIIWVDRLVEGMGIFKNTLYSVSTTPLNALLLRHKFLQPAKTGILRNNIEEDLFTSHKNPHSEGINAACVGITEPLKNQEFLIDLWEKVDPKVTLNIYGAGPSLSLLKQKVLDIGIGHRVIFHGWTDMMHAWPDIHLLLSPSKLEAAPNVILEALGTETPIFASQIGAHNEMLPKSCILTLHPEKWVRAINELALASPQDRLEYIRQCSDAKKQFSFDWDQRICDIIAS